MNTKAWWWSAPVVLALPTMALAGVDQASAPVAVAPAKASVAEGTSKPKRASSVPVPKGRLELRVADWAAAWVARDYGAYSRFYARSFVPADGASRDDWATQRQKRLAQPASIQLAVKDVRVKASSEDSVVTEFEQVYVSAKYRDRTLKTLQWVKVDGVWLIERETARPLPDSAASKREADK